MKRERSSFIATENAAGNVIGETHFTIQQTTIDRFANQKWTINFLFTNDA